MTPEFFIVRFAEVPYTQPFRYGGVWWRKTAHLGGGGDVLKKYVSNITGSADEICPASFQLFDKDTPVATEKTFLTLTLGCVSIE